MTHDPAYLCAFEAASNNKEKVLESTFCGCYYCCRTFDASDVTTFVGDPLRALCPECEIDSIVPDSSGLPVHSQEWLKLQNEYWFQQTVSYTFDEENRDRD